MAVIRQGNPNRICWKEYPDCPLYELSNNGDVRKKKFFYWSKDKCGKTFLNWHRARKIKPWDNGRGYLMFGITRHGKRTIEYVHRAIAKAFDIPNPHNYPEINHKNGNKSDNRVENIEWCNRSLNMKHARENGLHINSGEEVSWAKLTEGAVRKIKAAIICGISKNELAKIHGVSPSAIHAIEKERNWKNVKLNIVSYGYN